MTQMANSYAWSYSGPYNEQTTFVSIVILFYCTTLLHKISLIVINCHTITDTVAINSPGNCIVILPIMFTTNHIVVDIYGK